MHTPVLSREGIAQGPGAVRGAVVHQDNFKILHGLGQHGVHTVRKKGFRIIHGHRNVKVHGLPSHSVSQPERFTQPKIPPELPLFQSLGKRSVSVGGLAGKILLLQLPLA